MLERLQSRMMVLLSEKDEVVPVEMGERLFEVVMSNIGEERSQTQTPRKIIIEDALHENAWTERQWSVEMRDYIVMNKPSSQSEGSKDGR